MLKSNGNKSKQNLCVLCNVSTSDVARLGPMFQLDDLMVHYRCVLFAKRLECVFCNEKGATSGCCAERCEVVFHYPCGLMNGVLSQFKKPYSLYCSNHRPSQPSTKRFLQENELTDLKCNLCSEEVEIDLQYEEFLVTPCCSLIFHRECLQKYAISEDEASVCCPNCKNEKDFRQDMLDYGIYLPGEQSHLESIAENSDSSTFSDENEQLNLSMMHRIHLNSDEANDRTDSSGFNQPGISGDGLDHESRTTTKIEMVRENQEDEEMSINDQGVSETQLTAGIDGEVNPSTLSRNTLHRECKNSDQSNKDECPPYTEISKTPEFVGKFRLSAKKKASTPKTSPKTAKSSNHHNRKRKSPTSLSSDGQNSSPSEMDQFGSPKISRNGMSSESLNHGLGPPRRNLFSKNGISPQESPEGEEIQIIGGSEDPLYEEAMRKAEEMLSTALVQPDGRVNLKICKLCGYVTFARGSSTYHHKIEKHPDFRKTAEDLFKVEGYKRKIALSKLAQYILRSDSSKGNTQTVIEVLD
ncbi:uncharacterized protein LOC141858104 [Brevipalpus obovatus]|uniref:uncharacterized protein LOC141858104 n=1 Tax=Brevipalpus obovatus TaxID=246614 RepID=UPI003D9EAD3B